MQLNKIVSYIKKHEGSSSKGLDWDVGGSMFSYQLGEKE